MRTNHRHNHQSLDFDGSVGEILTVLMQTQISHQKTQILKTQEQQSAHTYLDPPPYTQANSSTPN